MKRRLFHFLGGLIFPTLCFFVSKPAALTVISLIFMLVILFEWLRRKYTAINSWVFHYLQGFFKEKEKQSTTGMFYFVSGVLITVALYTKPVAITALLFLTFGDVAAVLIGKRFGRRKILGAKSLEGSVAFFLVTFWVGVMIKKYFFSASLTNISIFSGALTATIAEALSSAIDDNFTVPIFTGLVLQLFRS